MGAKCQRYCPQAGARAGRPRRQLRGKTGSRPPPTRRTRRGGQPGGRLGPRQPLACPDRQGCLRTAGRAHLPRSPGLPTTGKRPGSGAEPWPGRMVQSWDRRVRPRLEGKKRTPFSWRVATPGRRAGAPPLWQLARSFPVTGPQPLSSLRRAGNRASRPGHRALARRVPISCSTGGTSLLCRWDSSFLLGLNQRLG